VCSVAVSVTAASVVDRDLEVAASPALAAPTRYEPTLGTPSASSAWLPLAATAPLHLVRALATTDLEAAIPTASMRWGTPDSVGSDPADDPATAPELPDPVEDQPPAPVDEDPTAGQDDEPAEAADDTTGGSDGSSSGDGTSDDAGGSGGSSGSSGSGTSSGSGSGGSGSGGSSSGGSGESGGSGSGSVGSSSGGSGSSGSGGTGGSGSGSGGSSSGGSGGSGSGGSSDPAQGVTPRPDLASSLAAAIASTRADAGLSALQRDGRADAVAQAWAEVLAADGQLRHNPDYARQLHAAIGPGAVAENVGMVAPADVSRLHGLFMGSPGHAANIRGDYRSLGVGAAVDYSGRLWAVHVFHRPS
jgi:uncharacterized protein YkwD